MSLTPNQRAAVAAREIADELLTGATLTGCAADMDSPCICAICLVRTRARVDGVRIGAKAARQACAGLTGDPECGTREEQAVFPLLWLADDLEAGVE